MGSSHVQVFPLESLYEGVVAHGGVSPYNVLLLKSCTGGCSPMVGYPRTMFSSWRVARGLSPGTASPPQARPALARLGQPSPGLAQPTPSLVSLVARQLSPSPAIPRQASPGLASPRQARPAVTRLGQLSPSFGPPSPRMASPHQGCPALARAMFGHHIRQVLPQQGGYFGFADVFGCRH